jgi:voltage-dependent potassium channel beta subunit
LPSSAARPTGNIDSAHKEQLMEYRRLGRTGIQVSALSFGSWVTFHNQSGVKQAVELMAAAHDHGVNFFDNAEVYAGGKSEEIMGEALRRLGWRRGSYLVSTKVFWGLHDGPNEKQTLNRKYLLESIHGCLDRLGLDHVDILFCHRDDPETRIGEIVRAMHDIVQRGDAIYWGTSEWEPERILEAIEYADRHHLHAPVVEQPVYNLIERHRFGAAYEPVYGEAGYGSTTWSPLASGLLTGKYNDGIPEGSRGSLPAFDWLKDRLTDPERLAAVRALAPIAESVGGTMAQFALAWCLRNPWVSTVITGASSVGQVKENMAALDLVGRMTPDILSEIDRVLTIP